MSKRKKIETSELTKTQLAVIAGTTLFPATIKDRVTGKSETALKIPGKDNKLGRKVTKGPWAGMPIRALTLVERETCDKACEHFADCYGNNMPFATRYQAGIALETQIEADLAELQRKYPAGLAVRLHVLGDFYSVSYVAQWAKWLGMFPALHIWGYSRWHPGTAIGDAVASLIQASDRFKIRFSGLQTVANGALSEDVPASMAKVEAKTAFICPEQTGQATNCGACGACWASNKPVVFLTH